MIHTTHTHTPAQISPLLLQHYNTAIIQPCHGRVKAPEQGTLLSKTILCNCLKKDIYIFFVIIKCLIHAHSFYL